MSNGNVYKSSDSNLESRVLKREIGLPECVTIIAGAVIGVGLFTVGSQQVGIWGTSIIFAALISVVITVFPSGLYGELASALPLAGGTYAYAKRAINYPVGIFVSWNYTIAQIGIAVAEGLAFANYLNLLIDVCGGPADALDPRFSGSILVLIFVVVNFFGIKSAGKAQDFFMYFFWIGSIIWFVVAFKDIDFNNFAPIASGIPPTVKEAAFGILMVLWCFFGFETVVGMGAEVSMPESRSQGIDSFSVHCTAVNTSGGVPEWDTPLPRGHHSQRPTRRLPMRLQWQVWECLQSSCFALSSLLEVTSPP